jgi:hypothetical protein
MFSTVMRILRTLRVAEQLICYDFTRIVLDPAIVCNVTQRYRLELKAVERHL